MFHFHQTPGQTWDQVVQQTSQLLASLTGSDKSLASQTALPQPRVHPQPPVAELPRSTPEQLPAAKSPAPPPPPTPPDALAWLAIHRADWPREVLLKADTSFPVIYAGRVAGTAVEHAGRPVNLIAMDLTDHTVQLASPIYGGTAVLPIRATNLDSLAQMALAHAREKPATATLANSALASAPPAATPIIPIAAGSTPSLTIVADHPIILYQADALGSSRTRVNLTVQPANFRPVTYSWSQVQDRINPLNSKGGVTFSTNDSVSAATTATFSTPGVYQIRLTATDGRTSLVRNTWVNVWDSTPVLNPTGRLGSYPDITPPSSVRTLSPDPGPFQHPRVLFTNQDWPEVSARDKGGAVASLAVAEIRKMVATTLDDRQTAVGDLVRHLDAYAQGGYQGAPPDITKVATSDDGGSPCMLASNPNNVYNMLLAAAYLAWIEQDPTVRQMSVPTEQQERCKYLARVTAAMARLEFASLWDRKTGTFHTDNPDFISGLDTPGTPIDVSKSPVLLALCYDFLYPWMDDAQRRDVRGFLYALSYGRHFSNGFIHQHGPDFGKPADALNQNGDFGNLNDFAILMALAIDGEETAVSPEVKTAFGMARGPDAAETNWIHASDPADPSAWPGSTVASVDNLNRQMLMLNQWAISPWGFTVTNIAYLGLTTSNYLPATVAFAHRGENAFVSSTFYNGAMAAFYTLQPSEGETKCPLGATNIFEFDHHDGGRARPFVYFIWKYMYPDDPMIDYVYRSILPGMWRDTTLQQPLMVAMFGLDPGVQGKTLPLEEVAAQKKLPLLKFDPQHSVVIAHNTWKADDLNLWFDCGWDPHPGHCHAERNSFSLYALGRVWSCPPGYHCTISDLQTSILVQDPALKADPASEGFIGASPSSATQEPPRPGNFPPLPGHLLEVTESPDQQWALVAGDATLDYNDGQTGGHARHDINTGVKITSFMYPGLMGALNARSDIFKKAFDQELMVSSDNYNPVMHAIRSVLFVRGQRPYVLSVDDFQKDNRAHNYRWCMNSAIGFAAGSDNRFLNASGHGVYSSLAIAAGASPSEATFYHSPVDDGNRSGLARLLVRDLSEQDTSAQPKIMLESRPPGVEGMHYLTYGIDNNHKDGGTVKIPSNRLLIERDQVVDPKYKILLFPYRTGDALPLTAWNALHTQLTIDLRNGTVDTITFTPDPDHRTRLGFLRHTRS